MQLSHNLENIAVLPWCFKNGIFGSEYLNMYIRTLKIGVSQ